MVVLLMASIPLRNSRSMLPQEKRYPTVLPMLIILAITSKAATMGFRPIFTTFLKENSSPRENIMKMTPIWLQSSMLWRLDTLGVYIMCGPARNPATM